MQSEVIRAKGRTARENANKMLLMRLNAMPVRRGGMAVKNLKMKAARAGMDLSQEELAELVGVTRQTIGMIEAGEVQPYAESLPGNLQGASQDTG